MWSTVRASTPMIALHTVSNATWLLPMMMRLSVERLGRQHPPLARDDRVDGDELRLDDVLEVGDLLVEAVVVVDEAVPVVLDPDVVLHREGDGRPRVRLELRRVDEVVGLRDGLGDEDVVAQALVVGVADLDLRLLFEAVALHAPGAPDDRVEPAVLEGVAGRDGDAAALADGELGHRVARRRPGGPGGAPRRTRAACARAGTFRPR